MHCEATVRCNWFRTEVDSEATCWSGFVMSAKLSDVSELRGTPCREHVAVSNGVTVSNVQIAPATTRTVHGNRSSIALHDTVLKRYRVAAGSARTLHDYLHPHDYLLPRDYRLLHDSAMDIATGIAPRPHDSAMDIATARGSIYRRSARTKVCGTLRFSPSALASIRKATGQPVGRALLRLKRATKTFEYISFHFDFILID